MLFGALVIVDSVKPARDARGWLAAAGLLAMLAVLGAADVLAAPGAIYQRIGAGGALELSNIPIGDGYTLLLAAPAPVVERPAPPAAAPVAAAVPAEAAAPVPMAGLDPNQLLEAAPPAAGVRAEPAAAPVAPAAAAPVPMAPVASNTPSATTLAARLARYRDFTVSRSTDMASP